MRKCERLVDSLFYLIDQRRMMPTLPLQLIDAGCLGAANDTGDDTATPTLPLTFSIVGLVAYAVFYMTGAVALRAYIARQINAAINRALVPLLDAKDIDMPD